MRKKSVLDELVKIAETNDTAEKTRAKLMANPRGGSDDISTIEKLYNVKPGTEKGMDYKNNIMEVAHPESKVLVNTYDKINGLVENNIERQNIILNIVNKQTDGQLAQFKYAKENLAKNLVRLGNFFDTKDNEDMVKLSDTCLNQMKKEGGWFIPIIVALVSGIAYARQHSNYAVRSVEENANTLTDILTEMSEYDGVLGGTFDVKYKESVVSNFRTIKNIVSKVVQAYKNIVPSNDVEPIMQDPFSPQVQEKTKKEIEVSLGKSSNPQEAAKQTAESKKEELDEISKKLESFQTKWDNVKSHLVSYIKKISDPKYINNAVAEKGTAAQIGDWVNRQSYDWLSGGYGLTAGKFDNLKQALVPFIESVDQAIELQKSALDHVNGQVNKGQVDQPINPASLDEDAEKLKL